MPRSSLMLGCLAGLLLLGAAYAFAGMEMTAGFYAGADRRDYARASVLWGAILLACLLASIGAGIAAWKQRRR